MQAGETLNRIFNFMEIKDLTHKLVLELFDYQDGKLYWKKDVSRAVKKGMFAGYYNKSGYYRIVIKKTLFFAHRIIFLYHKGYLPNVIDHIDRDPSNNLIENLRGCTQRQNTCNKTPKRNGTSKYLGVCKLTEKFNHKNGKVYSYDHWVASIKTAIKVIKIGRYLNEKDAALAYN